jgi:hypothetical protein
MRMILRMALAAAMAASLPAVSGAQTVVQGHLVDDGSNAPLGGGQVVLVGSEGRAQRRVTTDLTGRFSFQDITPGPFRMRASKLGFETAVTPYIQTENGDTVVVEVRLARGAVLLAPVTVVARSRPRPSIQLEGFYDRMEAGFGYFITRDDIQRRNASYISDLIMTVPGMRLGGTTVGGRRTVVSTRALRGWGSCPVQVFVDGFHMNRRGVSRVEAVMDSTGGAIFNEESDPNFSIDDHIVPNSIEGMEVYKGTSDVPAEFWTPDAMCGTVVIWSRRGR